VRGIDRLRFRRAPLAMAAPMESSPASIMAAAISASFGAPPSP
jgi:hypothetical protein